MKKISLLCLLLSAALTVAAQDSLRTALFNYNDTSAILIRNGKRLIADKISRNETKDVNEIVKLITQEAQKTNPSRTLLSAKEYQLLAFWTKDFKSILQDSLLRLGVSADNDYAYTRHDYYTYIAWNNVNLLSVLMQKMKEKKTKMRIETDLDNADISAEERAFLHIYLDKLLEDPYSYNSANEQSIIQKAHAFLKNYPQSRFQSFLRKNVLYEREDYSKQPNYTAIGWDIGGGYAQPSGALANNFKGIGVFTIGAELQSNKMLCYARLIGGQGSMKPDSIILNGIRLGKSDLLSFSNWDFGAGYVFAQNKINRSAITLGLGSQTIAPVYNKDKPHYSDINHSVFQTTGGLETNFLIQKTRHNSYRYSSIETLQLKLRYTYTQNFFQDNFNGGMHALTLHIGTFND